MKRSHSDAFVSALQVSRDFEVFRAPKNECVVVNCRRITIREEDGRHVGFLHCLKVLPEGLGLDPDFFTRDDDMDKCASLDTILRSWIAKEKENRMSYAYRYLLSTNCDIEPKQCIVSRSSISSDGSHIFFVFFIPAPEPKANSVGDVEVPIDLNLLVNCVSPEEVEFSGKHGKDLADLRDFVDNQGSVAFVANGSILPRMSGEEDLPARTSNRFLEGNELVDRSDEMRGREQRQVVAFKAPPELEVSFTLPRTGVLLTGMLVREGITVISGGGFQGKTTLLKALSSGYLDRIVGDGREYCVSGRSKGLTTLRAEDGRRVSSVDISAFISDLPSACGLDANNFSTSCASGSTSQATGVIEGLEIGTRCFLVDEDTSAVNFMIRDGRMRSLIDRETITPYIYRVSNLYQEKGVSTIVVVGGSGDWFDVQTSTILMDNYKTIDATARACRISKAFCSGHIQYNGQGVVHQLSWPGPGSVAPVLSLRKKEDKSGVKERFVDLLSLLCAIDIHSGSPPVKGDDNDNGNGPPYYRSPTLDFHVDDEGRSIRFRGPENTNIKGGVGLVLNLTRVEELTATGEAYASAVGVGIAIAMLVSISCCYPSQSQSQSPGGGSMETKAGGEKWGLSVDPVVSDREGLQEGLQETIILPNKDEEAFRWQRLNHLLDCYERSLTGNVTMLIDLGLGEKVSFSAHFWRSIGEGFVWPSRTLLGKALNRFPGAAFAISRNAESSSQDE